MGSGVFHQKRGAAVATPILWHSEYSAYIFANSHRENFQRKKQLKDIEPSARAKKKEK